MKPLLKGILVLFCLTGCENWALGQNAMPGQTSTNAAATLSYDTQQNSLQNPSLGSVPTGRATPQVLSLSLSDAIERGLRQNLGLLLAGDSQVNAQGQLWLARSPLLPDLSARITENAAQVNLAAEGFAKIAGRFPGFPLIVGPFGFFDARATFTQSLVDLNALANERSARQSTAAANFSYQDMREIVVLVVATNYLQAVAASARVDTAQAQLQTAQALHSQAVDMKNAGVSAAIDLLRAQVELQTRQQQLIARRNDFAKQELALARTIGLPLGQDFALSDKAPYEPPQPMTIDQSLEQAYASRGDFQAALAQTRAAEDMRRATSAEHLPTLSVYADYGIIGPTPNKVHGSFTTYAALRIPIFAGNKAHGDALLAGAALNRSRQQLENLRAQIEQDVRAGILDLQSASDQVGVATSNVDLAGQTLTQARDRFTAGISDNIEVIQAQEAVAAANESYIASLYSYNLSRVQLARATGSAEKGFLQYWKGK
jgi:outer membrane protein TolC